MLDVSRRALVKGAGALELAAGTGLLGRATAWAQTSPWTPEPGATLSCCAGSASCRPRTTPSWRWWRPSPRRRASRSRCRNESFDDIQPKASVAANTGQGPDMVWGLHSLPQLFAAKCVE